MNLLKTNDKKKSRQINMLEGSLYDKILLFALPLAASSILRQLFNSADVAVVGRFAGSQSLAAVGSNGPVISLLVTIFIGLSVGANVVVAKCIGQQREDKIQDAVHSAMAIALASGIFLLFLGYFLATPLLQLMDTPDDVMELAVLYLRIYFTGMPFFMIYNFGAAILNSTGDTRRPLYCLILSGILNVILNLILVIVFRLGVAGVGIATVVSNGVSAILVLRFLLNENEPIRLHLSKIRIKKENLIQIARIGVPAGAQGTIFSVSNVCILAAINGFGSKAAAGSAAALNFENLMFYIVNAFAQAAVTFTSQNYGAKQHDRCKKVFRICLFFALIFCALMCTSFVVGRDFFIHIYSTDPVVMKYGLIRMTYVLTLGFLISTYEVTGSALRGIGYSVLPTIIIMLGVCGVRMVWIYTVFQKYKTFEMLMIAYPITWVITGIIMISVYLIISKKRLINTQK